MVQKLGMGYLKRGFYERAIDRFNRAIEMEPDLISAYAYRAEAYRLSGKYEEWIFKCVSKRSDDLRLHWLSKELQQFQTTCDLQTKYALKLV